MFLKHVLYERETIKTTHNRIIILYSKYVVSDRFILILLSTYCGIYSIPKESNYSAMFMVVNNESQSVSLLCLSSIFITCGTSCILGKLSLKKLPLNLSSQLKYVVILLYLKGWSRTKKFHPCYYILFLPFPRPFIIKGNADNGKNSSLFFCICNLHVFKQKNYSHQVVT